MKNPEENLGLVMRVQVNKVDIHVPARDSHMVRCGDQLKHAD
jgi:hypothetical protein